MSSIDDLLLWDRNFYDNKLGKGTLLKEMQTRGVLNNGKQIEYALGLFISTYRGLPIVAHDGALFGYHQPAAFPSAQIFRDHALQCWHKQSRSPVVSGRGSLSRQPALA